MIKRSIFVLTDTKKDYSYFMQTLVQQFSDLEVLSTQGDFIEKVAPSVLDSSKNEEQLFVLFVASSYINQISGYLKENFHSINYILISFYRGISPCISDFTNLFDLVHATKNGFNHPLFFNRLHLEILNKIKISLLQHEVKEFYDISKSFSIEKNLKSLLEDYKKQNTKLESLSKQVLKAHEEERKRIAREIHDGIAQSVVNLSLKLELCKKYFQIGEIDKFEAELNGLNASIRSTSKEIRTVIYDLKPSYLEEGLLKALENHFNVFRENTGTQIVFTTSTGNINIEYYMASTIYRIVQEALTNIAKHAQASRVEVDFNIKNQNIFLVISDNGIGFDLSKLLLKKQSIVESGFGLEGIKERIELLKGETEIKSSPGKGTQITLIIPLPMNAPNE